MTSRKLFGGLLAAAALVIAGAVVYALVAKYTASAIVPGAWAVAEDPCPKNIPADWRKAQVVDGVDIEADPSCSPDDPAVIAAVVRGTNRASTGLMETHLSKEAVVKRDDRDGDGDPDDIHITLEVAELNGFSPDSPDPVVRFPIAPGIAPGAWVFAPKMQGMSTLNFLSDEANELLRLPSPVIRVEQGDRVRITLENSHYLPHTIHLHGVDHPFMQANGQGNDGVPMVSEMSLMPGHSRTYEFTARQTGSFVYHCHVQPQSHILMGLIGMIVVEENRPNNWLQTFNIGGGRVRHRSVASREAYDREYDLQYQEMDRELHNIVQRSNNPKWIAHEMNLKYKVSERVPEYYLLNGQSFPYTLRNSLVIVKPDEKIKLRVFNSGSGALFLHPHGHKPTVTHLDGIKLANPFQRDVIEVGPAQRVEMDLVTKNDGLNSYGEGAWLMHDHHEPGVTTDGINPGGDVSLIAYESTLNESGMPKTAGPINVFFDPAYYRGEIEIFDCMEGMMHGDERACKGKTGKGQTDDKSASTQKK